MIVWCALAWAAPTEAELDRAMELYDNGQALYAEGNYEDAIAAWTRSYEISGREALLFNLANAQERLGRYEEAIASLNRYRAFADGDERAQLDQRVRNLEKLAERQRQSRPEPEPEPVPAPEPIPVPVVVEPIVEPVPELPVQPAASGRTRKVVAGVLFGAGAAAWGGAVATGLSYSASRARIAELCVNLEQGITCPAEAEEPLRKQTAFAYATDALLLVGAAAGGVGVGLAFGKRAEVAVTPSGLVVSGRF